jgi:hypothetical protein
MKDFLPTQEVIRLKAAHRLEKDRKRADRIKTIPLLHKGFTYPQIAELLMLDETSIRRYEKEYETTGVAGLLEDRYHGGMGLLPEIEIRSLENHLQTHTYQSVKQSAPM